MCSELKNLINDKILKVEKVSTVDNQFASWAFETENCSIGIYNPIKIGINEKQAIDLLETDACLLVNHLIVDVQEKERDYVMFELDNHQKIYISIKENDFSGPEAGEFYFTNGDIIVIQEE